jgi:endonuclease/exonuclease/phosphatase family metal-dependent hydrolase
LGQTLRILSANLWNGGADPEAFADLVTALAVDAVCVQELAPAQADALASVMPHGELHPNEDFTGMGIALRAPAKIERVEISCRDVRVAQLQPCDWPVLSAPLELMNLHMAAPHTLRPRLGMQMRVQQMRAFLPYLKRPDAPAQRVLVGDFNATPVWPVYRQIASHMSDAAVAVARRRGERAQPTWGPWSGSPRLIRIDHAMVNGVEVEDFRVVHVEGSDHSAVVVDVVPGPRAPDRA